MRLCLNCHTENPLDAVSCSECGMSLARAPTGDEAENLLQARRAEIEAASSTTKWKPRKDLELPLTASGLLYLFGEEFADPEEGRLSGSQTRLVRSGRTMGSVSLAHSLFLAAFVSLAQQGYISLRLDERRPREYAERLTVTKERGGEALPPSLEREIMDSISGDPSENRVKAVVGMTVSGTTKAEAVKWTVGYVIDTLDEAGYLDWVLEPGLLEYKVHRWADEDAVAPLAAELQTLKDTLRNFELADPHLYGRLRQEVKAGFGFDTAWLELFLGS